MWTKGMVDGYDYCIKHFNEGSIYGIDGGKISKLEIRRDGKIHVNYDRGWDIEPQGAEVKAVFEKILRQHTLNRPRKTERPCRSDER